MRFLNAELALLKRTIISLDRAIDTVRLARQRFPGAPASLMKSSTASPRAPSASSREIADTLYISPRTATTHVANILAKLDVSSRSGAVALAFQHKIV